MAYPEYILKYLRLRSGMDENDHSFDKRFNAMNSDTVFEEVLRWQGIIGWGTQIRSWIEGIYGVDLDKPQLGNESLTLKQLREMGETVRGRLCCEYRRDADV